MEVEVSKDKEWSLLEDIRTLIVHSGEQLTQIASLELQGYKDAQLGWIQKVGDSPFESKDDKEKYDYCLSIWTDKHDKSKKHQENEIGYDNRKENYRDLDIYLSAKDVSRLVLFQIEKFIAAVFEKEPELKTVKLLPNQIKEQTIYAKEPDFDKLEKLLRTKKRSGYFVENGREYWLGFGLKRLWHYAHFSFFIPESVKEVVDQVIRQRLADFWESYNNGEVSDDKIPSLDVRDVFKDYSPEYEKKNYLEREKLFKNIAPSFNYKDEFDSTDVDYLARFITEASHALETSLNLENSVDGIICDYFIKSIQKKLEVVKDGR